jgi:pimeloyl-ACP methyl ester carboxylesterase
MRVFHFGEPGRRLLGSHHTPPRLRPSVTGILLCNPFGEEAIRAHRIYRVLATQFERAGYPALRFDYSGTGDSVGMSEDASLGAWLNDIGLATAELQAASAARGMVAVGMRLGATLAALATSRTALRFRHLVLWDPIIEVRPYLVDLGVQHRRYMREELEGWQDDRAASADGLPAEALGTPIAPGLAAELAAIDLSREPVQADHVTIVSTTRTTPALERFITRLPPKPATTLVSVTIGDAWNSDAALNASIVPMEVIRAVVGRIEEVSP